MCAFFSPRSIPEVLLTRSLLLSLAAQCHVTSQAITTMNPEAPALGLITQLSPQVCLPTDRILSGLALILWGRRCMASFLST